MFAFAARMFRTQYDTVRHPAPRFPSLREGQGNRTPARPRRKEQGGFRAPVVITLSLRGARSATKQSPRYFDGASRGRLLRRPKGLLAMTAPSPSLRSARNIVARKHAYHWHGRCWQKMQSQFIKESIQHHSSKRTKSARMNIFDAIVIGAALIAAGMGYRSGLLRSLATILGYVAAAPLAIAVTPMLSPYIKVNPGVLLFGIFLIAGIVVSAGLRSAVSVVAGEDPNTFDRLAGGLLGAGRIALVAVLMVLIFDHVIPSDMRPEWLTESRLQPWLAMAAEHGLRTLPPDVIEYIDRVKRAHGL
jgi:membrane protein required for colicin V production